MRKLACVYIFILIGSTACIDPIDFDVPRDTDFLVVDGFITDDNGPHRIRLTKSSVYANVLDGGIEASVSNAAVAIVDNQGNITNLQETSTGNYETSSQFSGEVGNQYFLQISLNGKTYRSTTETLRAASKIKSVSYQYLSKPFVNEFNNTVDDWGIEFYANIDLLSDVTYYKWDWEVDYELLQVLFNEEEDPEMPDTCYVHETTSGFINLLINESDQIEYKDYPVSFVPVDYKFNSKYSMNLIQYTMSEQAAEFWEQVSLQTDISGSIFDPTPAKIVGNIRNINDEKEEVLGYFGAFGKSEKRAFLDNFNVTVLLDLDTIFHDDLDLCTVVDSEIPDFCFNCAAFPGSKRQKPVFWE